MLPVQKTDLFKASPQRRSDLVHIGHVLPDFCFIRLFKEVLQGISHDFVSQVGGMIAVVKELGLTDHPALSPLFVELLHHRIPDADHGQVIGFSHGDKPFLQVPVVGKDGKEQDYAGLSGGSKDLSNQRVIALTFGLIPVIVDRKLHHDQIRHLLSLQAYIPVIADHAQLRGGSSHPGFAVRYVFIGALSRQMTEGGKSPPGITGGVNGGGSGSLGDGAPDKGQLYLFPGSGFFQGFFNPGGISHPQQGFFQHLPVIRG